MYIWCTTWQLHSWQVARSKLQMIATSTGKAGERYVIKRFLTDYEVSRNFPDFLRYQLLRVISEFRKIKHYKSLMRIVGGDSKQTIYVATHEDPQLNIYLHNQYLLFRCLFGTHIRKSATRQKTDILICIKWNVLNFTIRPKWHMLL